MLVRVHAAALNPRDLQVLGGLYGYMTKHDLIPATVAQSVESLRSGRLEVHPIRVETRQKFIQMNQAFTLHQLRPVITRSYEFSALPTSIGASRLVRCSRAEP